MPVPTHAHASDRYPSFTAAAKLCMYSPAHTPIYIRTLDPAPRRTTPDTRMGRRRMSFTYFVAAEDRERSRRAQQAELARAKAELAHALTELHHAHTREERTRARRRSG